LSFRAFSSKRSGLTQIFVESCVDFEVAHLSVLMVRRLAYPEIPTLNTYNELTMVECLAIEAYCCSPDPIVSDILCFCRQIFVWIQVSEYPDLCKGPTID